MVFFTCGNCGESVKKPSIAKHYMTKCRGPPNVTCVDCLKDFRGNEYEAHIKCITEEERYSAKGFVPKPSSNKGEKKQQSWCEALQELLASNKNLKPDERDLLTSLSSQDNVPRKRGKFINFINNAYRANLRRPDLVERVWNILEETCKTPAKDANQVAENDSPAIKESLDKEANGVELTTGKEKKKKKKNKVAEEIQQDDEAVEINENGHNGVNHVDDLKKNKRKSQGSIEIVIAEKKAKLEGELNPVKEVLEAAGGSLSLYKFLRGLQETFSNQDDAEKALKKLQKNITVSLR